MQHPVASLEDYSSYEHLIRLIFKGLIPLVLLVVGVWLFTASVQLWSGFLGLPLIIIGMMLAIYTFDEITNQALFIKPTGIGTCHICGKASPCFANMNPEDIICFRCKEIIKAELLANKTSKK